MYLKDTGHLSNRGKLLTTIDEYRSMDATVGAILIGVLQGLLEWLPISSQGNLVIFMSSLLGIDPLQALNTSVFLHIGTGLAAIVYFRTEIINMLLMKTEHDKTLFKYLFVTTAFTGLIGLPLFLFARTAGAYGEMLLAVTGLALIGTGVLQRQAKGESDRDVDSLHYKEGVIMGLAQGFAAIPGLSRSGLTTSILLFKNYTGEAAFRISFLMSIPSVFAAAAGLIVLEGVPTFSSEMGISLISSFLTALLSIDLLLKLARRIKFWGLCIILGLIALLPQIANLVI